MKIDKLWKIVLDRVFGFVKMKARQIILDINDIKGI